MNPHYPSIATLFLLLLSIIPHADAFSPSLAELDQKARALTSRRFTDEAQTRHLEETVADMTKADAEDPRTLFWKGYLLDRAQQSAQAAKVWKRSLDLLRSSNDASGRRLEAETAILLGAWELGEGRGQAAADRAEQAIQADPRKVDAYRLLIDASFQLGQLDHADDLLAKQTANLASVPSDVLMVRFTLLNDRGQWKEIERLVLDRRQHRPTCPTALYFAGRLADRAGNESRAMLLFVLASLNGAARADSTMKADEWISKRAYERLAHPEDAPRDLLWVHDLVARYEIGMRRGLPIDFSERDQAAAAAKALPAASPEERLARDHLVATLELLAGRPKLAQPIWNRLTTDFPDFVPAWCRRAEIEEVDPKPQVRDQAISSWKKAFDQEPDHPLVRDRIRLGVEIQPTDQGVLINQLARWSPAQQIGWNPGDVILSIGSQKLAELPPIDRLRLVRLFSGGPLRRQDPSHTIHEDDVSLLLLD
jgi:tetratricopeptide (TPR) repeat protein